MSSPRLEDTMNNLFRREIPLSPAQIQRVARASVGVLLAGHAQLPKIARWLDRPGTQAGRIQFLQRLLNAPFMTQELVYQPLVSGLLQDFRDEIWHILIDRSTLEGYEAEMLMIGLAFRGRAIPLVWEVIDFGCTSAEGQIALWRRVLPLIPTGKPVVAHGDTEFGSVKVMRFMREQGWDFILGQLANTRYCAYGTERWYSLRDLNVTKRHPVYLARVEWTEQHCYGPLNVFAFFAPHQNSPESPRRDIRYQATTLPIAHTLRCVGRRRWGIEPFFKDCKSAGWNVELSALSQFERRDSLLILLSTAYLWATCIGRWLCKTSRRREIDAKPSRQLSLFRMGWDWLVSQYRQGHGWPLVTTLYS